MVKPGDTIRFVPSMNDVKAPFCNLFGTFSVLLETQRTS